MARREVRSRRWKRERFTEQGWKKTEQNRYTIGLQHVHNYLITPVDNHRSDVDIRDANTLQVPAKRTINRFSSLPAASPRIPRFPEQLHRS